MDKLKSLKLEPDTPIGLIYLSARVLIAEGKYNEAEGLLKPYKDKENPEVLLALGDLYFKTQRPDKAWKAFYQVNLDPSSTKGLFLKIGQALQLKKQWQGAETLYRIQLNQLQFKADLTTLDKELLLKTYDRLGVVLWMQGKINEAADRQPA